ncbi:FAD-dependent oxidoreductase [Rhodomicrobium vannielii]|uniref:FAD-dependent oxidoreductase n=1 Tax=Rhodomicrobium vannielii TaxID=1069 RepID=UPI001AECAD8C|nr:FAD-dependent oxidoreductase [Rhodomicrobium vannielii]
MTTGETLFANIHALAPALAARAPEIEAARRMPLDVVAMLDPRGPVAQAALRQIKVVHGLDAAIAAPLSVAFMNWRDDPHGGGWHTWNRGVKSWEVMQAIAAPLPETALHIVGEAWSSNQGWVEGALETATGGQHGGCEGLACGSL